MRHSPRKVGGVVEGECISLFHYGRSGMRVCKFDAHISCWHTSCSVFNCCSGSVFVCPLHPNPSGFFMRRRAMGFCLSLIQIWALSKRRS